MINYADLNEAQFEAVFAKGIPLKVTAGPGSGKTRVITTRIAHLIAHGTEPYNVLAVTFTNRAAAEMRSRLRRLIDPEAAAQVWIGTFHGLCSQMLRRDGKIVGVPRQFAILSGDEQMQVVKRILRDQSIHDISARQALTIISKLKAAQATGDHREPSEEIARVLNAYQTELSESQALDFDDLLIKGLELLTTDAPTPYQSQFEHVLVDEFQDTSRLQYLIAKAWSRHHRSLTIVGDPDQSIYSWRSADPQNFAWFDNDHPDAEEIPLLDNYRSTPQVVQVANQVIEPHPNRNGRRIASLRQTGSLPTSYQGYSESDEAIWIVNTIAQYLRDGVKPSEIAVMYRTNAQSRSIEEACIQATIPYRLIGAARFYDRREVRDIVAYLRVISNPNDSISLRRIINVPARGIGAVSIKQLEQQAHELNGSLWDAVNNPPAMSSRATATVETLKATIEALREEAATLTTQEIVEAIIERTEYRAWIERQSANEFEAEARIENLEELENIAAGYRHREDDDRTPLTRLLEDIALYASSEQPSQTDAEAVTLTTLHQAKGLEYPIVYIAGVEEGLIPHSQSTHDQGGLEEERRLLYVGVTRAMDVLHLTYSSRRTVQGMSRPCSPSRFLKELPEQLVQAV